MDRQQSWLGIRTPQLIVIYYQFLWKQTYQLGQAGYTYTAYKSDNTEKIPCLITTWNLLHPSGGAISTETT